MSNKLFIPDEYVDNLLYPFGTKANKKYFINSPNDLINKFKNVKISDKEYYVILLLLSSKLSSYLNDEDDYNISSEKKLKYFLLINIINKKLNINNSKFLINESDPIIYYKMNYIINYELLKNSDNEIYKYLLDNLVTIHHVSGMLRVIMNNNIINYDNYYENFIVIENKNIKNLFDNKELFNKFLNDPKELIIYYNNNKNTFIRASYYILFLYNLLLINNNNNLLIDNNNNLLIYIINKKLAIPNAINKNIPPLLSIFYYNNKYYIGNINNTYEYIHDEYFYDDENVTHNELGYVKYELFINFLYYLNKTILKKYICYF